MAIDVDAVCTVQDLVDEVGGHALFEQLISDDTQEQRNKVREKALFEVLEALRGRTPPILETDLANPVELKLVVTYGSLAKLYRQNMTTSDSVNAKLASDFQKLFDAAKQALRPTLIGEATPPPPAGYTTAFGRR